MRAYVSGYEGLYEVDEEGNIYSCTRSYPRLGRDGRIHYLSKEGHKLTSKKRGLYLAVTLYKEGKKLTHSIHRLVARAFIDNPKNLPQVNHIDEDKHNNSVLNLEWCTASHNQSYSKSKKTVLISPEGELVEVFNMREFCRGNNLWQGSFWRMIRGTQKTHKGWELSSEPL
jgi:hypothetical protein